MMTIILQIDTFFKLISDFSMEYRTAHSKLLQRMARKKQEQNRIRTKGKLIVS